MASASQSFDMPSYYIYREGPIGDEFDPTAPFHFFPPKDSDELFFALRSAFPHVSTHSERMRNAVIEFLLTETPPHAISLEPSPAMPFEDATILSMTTSPLSSLNSLEYYSSSSSSNGASPVPASNTSPSMASSSSQARLSTQPRLESMTGVFSVSSTEQPKVRQRRKMTEAERLDYRKRRSAGACDSCVARKRKCKHNKDAPSSTASVATTNGVVKSKSKKAQGKQPAGDAFLSSLPHSSRSPNTAPAGVSYNMPSAQYPSFDDTTLFPWTTDADWTLLDFDTESTNHTADSIADAIYYPHSEARTTRNHNNHPVQYRPVALPQASAEYGLTSPSDVRPQRTMSLGKSSSTLRDGLESRLASRITLDSAIASTSGLIRGAATTSSGAVSAMEGQSPLNPGVSQVALSTPTTATLSPPADLFSPLPSSHNTTMYLSRVRTPARDIDGAESRLSTTMTGLSSNIPTPPTLKPLTSVSPLLGPLPSVSRSVHSDSRSVSPVYGSARSSTLVSPLATTSDGKTRSHSAVLESPQGLIRAQDGTAQALTRAPEGRATPQSSSLNDLTITKPPAGAQTAYPLSLRAFLELVGEVQKCILCAMVSSLPTIRPADTEIPSKKSSTGSTLAWESDIQKLSGLCSSLQIAAT